MGWLVGLREPPAGSTVTAMASAPRRGRVIAAATILPSGLKSPPDAFLAQIAAIRDHEFAHADAISTTLDQLGAEVPAEPNFTFPEDATADPATFLGYAATLEPVGIGAYQGAAPALESKDILAAAISIHNAECQHRCAINILNLVNPPNDVAFEEALPLKTVQEAAAPFGITG